MYFGARDGALLPKQLTSVFGIDHELERHSHANHIIKIHDCFNVNKAFTEILAFIAVLVFKLFSRKVLARNRKDNKNC